MVYQLPSSFVGGINQAGKDLANTRLPQVPGAVIDTNEIKQIDKRASKLPQKKVEKKKYVPLTREQFDSAQKAGFTPDQIIEMEKRRKTETEGVTPPVNSDTGITYNADGTIDWRKTNSREHPEEFTKFMDSPERRAIGKQQDKDLFTGILTGGIKGVGNIGKMASFVADAFLPGQPTQAWGNRFQESARGTADLLQKKIGVNPDSKASGVGEFTGQTGLGMLAGGALGSVASKLTGAGEVGAPLLAKVATGASEGIGYDAVATGKPGVGTILGGVLPVVGATYNKAKELISNALPKSFIARGMATPSALKNASERLSRLADDGIVDIEAAPQWMLDKGLQGSKKEIQNQLVNVVKTSGEQKAALIASKNAPLSNVPQVSDLQQAMGEVLSNFAKVTKKGEIIPTAGNKEIVEEIVSFINNKTPTLAEFERARSLLGNMGIFNKGGALADSAQKEGLQKIWIQASKYMDETLPGFRALNKDIEVAQALRNAIGLKEAQDSARNLLTFTNLGMGGLGASYGYAKEGNIGGALTYGLGALGAKYVINNPAVLTRLAQLLKKTGPILEGVGKLGATKGIVIPAITQSAGN